MLQVDHLFRQLAKAQALQHNTGAQCGQTSWNGRLIQIQHIESLILPCLHACQPAGPILCPPFHLQAERPQLCERLHPVPALLLPPIFSQPLANDVQPPQDRQRGGQLQGGLWRQRW